MRRVRVFGRVRVNVMRRVRVFGTVRVNVRFLTSAI